MNKEIPPPYHHYLENQIRSIFTGVGKHRLTIRGFWVGSFLSFFLAIGAPYGNMIIKGSFMALDISTPGAIFLFLFLIGVLNLVLKLTARSLIGAGLFALLAGASWLAACESLEALDPHSPGLIFCTFVLLSAWSTCSWSAGASAWL